MLSACCSNWIITGCHTTNDMPSATGTFHHNWCALSFETHWRQRTQLITNDVSIPRANTAAQNHLRNGMSAITPLTDVSMPDMANAIRIKISDPMARYCWIERTL